MVEVAADRADGVLETLNNGVFIGGIKVTAVMEAGASGPHPRRPFTPGPRRLHPGVSGKKPRGATSGKKKLSDSALGFVYKSAPCNPRKDLRRHSRHRCAKKQSFANDPAKIGSMFMLAIFTTIRWNVSTLKRSA